ncbi:hypothetical protein [Nocardia arizonensis]|uniref:hypothetical protein n=1 Tax=Nocardia arizonensis TaxID=1141647 RepID=UPI0006D12CD2|nr:hypothetical protein [Nocardia arizonensis]
MVAKDSRRDDPPFTEQGYWIWRDRLESALPVENPERADILVGEAESWYAIFRRAHRRALILRTLGYLGWASVVAATLVAACVFVALRWHEQRWLIAVCAIVALLVLYRYISTLAAARAAHRLESRTLTRQFPDPRVVWADMARKHGFEPTL